MGNNLQIYFGFGGDASIPMNKSVIWNHTDIVSPQGDRASDLQWDLSSVKVSDPPSFVDANHSLQLPRDALSTRRGIRRDLRKTRRPHHLILLVDAHHG